MNGQSDTLTVSGSGGERRRSVSERELQQSALRTRQLQQLTTATLVINSTTSLQELLTKITESAAAIVGTHQAVTSINTGSDSGKAINSAYLSGRYSPSRDGDIPPNWAELCTQVCRLHRSFRMTQADLESDPELNKFINAPANDPPMRGWLAVPLTSRDGDAIGAIQLSDRFAGDFTAEDEAIVTQLAQTASVTIENARLLQAEKAARTQAQSAQSRYRALVEGLDAIVWEADPWTRKFSFVNRRAESLLGCSAERWIKEDRFWANHIHPHDRERAISLSTEAIAAGRDYELEYRVIGTDGKVTWVRDIVNVVKDGTGTASRIRGIMMDITGRKQTETALQQSEERYRSLANVEASIVWTASVEGNFVQEIPAWQAFTGQSFAECQGDGWIAALHPHDRQRVRSLWQDVLAREEPLDTEYRLCRFDGEYRDMSVRATPVRDNNGTVREWVGSCLDITDRKRAQEDLRKSEALNSVIFDSSSDCLELLDLDAKLLFVNGAGRRLLKINDVTKFVGLSWFTFWSGSDRKASQEAVRLAASGKQGHFQGFSPATDGHPKWWDVVVTPIYDAHNKVQRLLVASRDITERRQAEETLRKSEKLASAGRMAAVIAHEINNPLEAITNLLYLIGKQPLGPAAGEFLELAESELKRVVHIAKQTLGFYRETSKPLSLNLQDLMEEILDLFAPQLQKNNIRVLQDYPSRGTIHAFPGEIRQLLTNIVANALEAESSCLRIRVKTARDWKSGRVGVRLAVVDDGRGISPENLRYVFDPFFTTKGEKGTGLGLWVSRGIVVKYEGCMRVRSSVRPKLHGTCFSIFFPSEAITVKKDKINKSAA